MSANPLLDKRKEGRNALNQLGILAGAGGFEPPTTGFGDQRSDQTELRSCVVPLEGLEPPTRDLGRRRSIQLSYRGRLVEIGGLEPPTSALRTPRSPS